MGLFKKHRYSNPLPDKVYNQQLAINQANNCIRIIQESSQILQETTNPETFFSRLALFEEQIETLKQLSSVIALNVSPEELAVTLNKDKQEIIYRLIVRRFNFAFEKAEQLKTDKGKKNQYQQFYDEFQPYLHLMNEDNIRYLEYKYHSKM